MTTIRFSQRFARCAFLGGLILASAGFLAGEDPARSAAIGAAGAIADPADLADLRSGSHLDGAAGTGLPAGDGSSFEPPTDGAVGFAQSPDFLTVDVTKYKYAGPASASYVRGVSGVRLSETLHLTVPFPPARIERNSLPNSLTTLDFFHVSAPARDASTGLQGDAIVGDGRSFSPFEIASAKLDSVRWIPTSLPISLLPQASGTSPIGKPTASPAPLSQKYWTKRRVVILTTGLALTGAGVAMFMAGGNVPNPNYNPNACGPNTITSVGLAGAAALCNQTNWSGIKFTGLVTMVIGLPVMAISFIPGIR